MHKRITYFLISFILLYNTNGKAQEIDYDSSYVAIDSIGSIEDIIEPPVLDEGVEEEETSSFENISSEDKVLIASRKVDDSTVSKMRRDDDFWYVNEAPVKEKPKEPKESFLQKLGTKVWFRNLLWFLVVGGFVAVLIWFIISSDIQLFKRSAPPIARSQEDELVNQSIFDIDYDSEIQKAITAQNLRLAVRLLFLQTLKDLSEKNIINYKQERTNSDYLLQLYNTTYYEDFFRLTRHFEYIWYGQFSITPTNFEVIKNDFFTFKQRFLL